MPDNPINTIDPTGQFGLSDITNFLADVGRTVGNIIEGAVNLVIDGLESTVNYVTHRNRGFVSEVLPGITSDIFAILGRAGPALDEYLGRTPRLASSLPADYLGEVAANLLGDTWAGVGRLAGGIVNSIGQATASALAPMFGEMANSLLAMPAGAITWNPMVCLIICVGFTLGASNRGIVFGAEFGVGLEASLAQICAPESGDTSGEVPGPKDGGIGISTGEIPDASVTWDVGGGFLGVGTSAGQAANANNGEYWRDRKKSNALTLD